MLSRKSMTLMKKPSETQSQSSNSSRRTFLSGRKRKSKMPSKISENEISNFAEAIDKPYIFWKNII
jgi:hypothetical protein